MKFKNILVLLATLCLFGCPSPNSEQENWQDKENFVQFYDFSPVYIQVQNKINKKKGGKTKFYNFDDLLIEGEYKKPKSLYLDGRQKVKFQKLLKLKKDFLPDLKNTAKDPSLR
jgi:hypothetical protein